MTTEPRSCDVFERDLSAWIDGELAPARAAALRAHLDACDACAARVVQLRAVDASLLALPATAPAADLRARLQQRIDAPDGEAAALARGRRTAAGAAPVRHQRRFAWRVAAAAAAAALAVLLLRPEPGRDPQPATSPPAPLASAAPERMPEVPSPDEEPARQERLAADRTAPPERGSTPRALAQAPGNAPARSLPSAGAVSLEDLELETVEDLEVIANLELLEALLALDEGTG